MSIHYLNSTQHWLTDYTHNEYNCISNLIPATQVDQECEEEIADLLQSKGIALIVSVAS